ncbi:MAG: sigma-E factor negative regulatory protein, partial [Terriglobales bacterium]
TDAARTLSALREDGEVRQTWRIYHLIGDALHDTRVLSQRFSERMAASLAAEPTVLAPAVAISSAQPWRRYLMPVAAGVAGAAFVGSVAFLAPLQEPSPAPQVAQVPPQVRPTPASVVAEPARVPLPVATDDYLLAHQGYSPRNLLQGVAPYARTVSGQALEGRR